MAKETRVRRGKEVVIPEEFREKAAPKRFSKKSPPRKGRLPEVRRDREMARAPRIDEDWG